MWKLLLNSVLISAVLWWRAEGGIRREIVCRLSVYPNGRNINWTCPEQKAVYIEKGWYIPKNILPSRVQILGNKAYILTPKFSSGVPFSLGVISMGGPCKAEPVLSPFPSWESQDPTIGGAAGGSGIVNAVDVFLDPKKILWVLDIGITETLDKPLALSPPKVHAICIQSATVVAVVDLSAFSTPESRFHELQIEVTEEEDTYVYVSDSGSKAIIVWDYSKSAGYTVALPPAVADEGSCKDILYLTLMSPNMLYFSFMNGRKLYRTSTSNLRCSKTLTEVEEIGTRPGKLVILGSDKKSKLFFRGKGDNQIFIWDTHKPFKFASFVQIDAPMQGMYGTHVSAGYMRLMWALSSNFPDFATGNRSSVGPFVKLHPICSATRCGEEATGSNTGNCGNGSTDGNGGADGNCNVGGSSGNGSTDSKNDTGSDDGSRNGSGGTGDSADCDSTKAALLRSTDNPPASGRGYPVSPTATFKVRCPAAAERGAVITLCPSCPQLIASYTSHRPDICPRCGHIH